MDDQTAVSNWIREACLVGFALTKLQILIKVKELSRARDTNWNTRAGVPNRQWFNRFLVGFTNVSKRRKAQAPWPRAGATVPRGVEGLAKPRILDQGAV